MTDYKLTQTLMAKALAAKTGHEPAETVEFVAALLEIGLAMNLITAQRLELAERDAKMYELRTQHGVSPADIAARFGVKRNAAQVAIRGHLTMRRAV